MTFNVEDYRDIECVMHCSTQEEADEFLRFLDSNGYKWCTGERYTETDTKWENYREDTVYYFNEGEYCSLEYACCALDCMVLEWSDFSADNDVELEETDESEFLLFLNAG